MEAGGAGDNLTSSCLVEIRDLLESCRSETQGWVFRPARYIRDIQVWTSQTFHGAHGGAGAGGRAGAGHGADPSDGDSSGGGPGGGHAVVVVKLLGLVMVLVLMIGASFCDGDSGCGGNAASLCDDTCLGTGASPCLTCFFTRLESLAWSQQGF